MPGLVARLGLLGTKVGRRYLLLFLVAAMTPVLLLTLTGGWYVRSMLEDQARDETSRLAKSVSLTLLASLASATRDVRTAARQEAGAPLRLGFVDELVASSPDSVRPRLTDDERAHLRAGRVLLHLRRSGVNSELMLGIQGGPDGRGTGMRWFILSPQVVWSPIAEVVNGEGAELCVFEVGSLRRIRCTDGVTPDGERAARLAARGAGDGRSALSDGEWVTGTRDIFLRFDLGAGSWRLVALQSRQVALASASGYTSSAAALLFLTLVLVFVLTHAQIRRSTVPLQQLRDASARVADGDFAARVAVRGSDEYAEVGSAFNGMTAAIQQQVRLLHGMGEIDRSVLASRQIGGLVDAALTQLAGAHPGGTVALLVRRVMSADIADIWWLDSRERVRPQAELRLPAGEHDELLGAEVALRIPGDDASREYVARSRGAPLDAPTVVLPLRHDGQLIGAVLLHGVSGGSDESWRRGAIARLTERVALALANVLLVERLDALSIGTLSAFARTIETNSVWSAGHAERVTALALVIGRRMGVSGADEEALHRGALLHDIGKIGVPSFVLDKPGALDEDEMALMRRHPELGERILQPIPAFVDVLPIVRSHHERRDGSGYPDGLVGDAIHPLARIVSVADVYDALMWNRPYRPAFSPQYAVAHLFSNADKFDPQVLAAFRDVAEADLLHARPVWRDGMVPELPNGILPPPPSR